MKRKQTIREETRHLHRMMTEEREGQRQKLLDKLIAQRDTDALMADTQPPSIEERLRRLECRDQETWSLMMAVISDSLAQALRDADSRAERKRKAAEELPIIEDRASFVAYVSMVARHLKERRITAAEGRGLLYGAQLTYAALKGGEIDANPPLSQLPRAN